MRKPIPLRLDHDAAGLRGLARASEDADQVRRLLALALIYDGGSRTQAAAAGGVTLQVVRDWVLRFNAHGPGGLIDRTAPGQPSRLNDEQRAELAAMVENGPIPAVHGVIRWRIIDLSANGSGRNTRSASRSRRSAASCGPSDTASCRRAHAITRRRRAPSRLSKKVARHTGGDRAPAGRRCRRYRGVVRRRSQDRPEEQDHPSLGEAGFEVHDTDSADHAAHLARRTALTEGGSRPSAPSDQRTASTYIFGAICPKEGKAVGLILPWCNTAMMDLHLAAISADVAPGRHAALLLDQAGWHLSAKLTVPDNITIVPLPPKSPELNPQENVWQYMRGNWLSNRVFDNADALLDHCCDAWNKLEAQPWTIMSIGLRNWAHGS